MNKDKKIFTDLQSNITKIKDEWSDLSDSYG